MGRGWLFPEKRLRNHIGNCRAGLGAQDCRSGAATKGIFAPNADRVGISGHQSAKKRRMIGRRFDSSEILIGRALSRGHFDVIAANRTSVVAVGVVPLDADERKRAVHCVQRRHAKIARRQWNRRLRGEGNDGRERTPAERRADRQTEVIAMRWFESGEREGSVGSCVERIQLAELLGVAV